MAITQKIYNDEDRELFINAVMKIDLVKPYIAECKVYRKKRSLKQNDLYHLWLACISSETGYDTGWLHDYFRDQYLPKQIRMVFGKTREYLMSTTNLNTEQFTVYLQCIDIFAKERAIQLKYPVDLEFEKFYERYKEYIG